MRFWFLEAPPRPAVGRQDTCRVPELSGMLGWGGKPREVSRPERYWEQRLGVLGSIEPGVPPGWTTGLGSKEATVVEVQGWLARHFRNGGLKGAGPELGFPGRWLFGGVSGGSNWSRVY